MTDISKILISIEAGERQATAELLPLVYDELRRLAAVQLAHEKPGQSLNATALVHEAYLRLVGDEDAANWDNRRHFFAAAATSIRRITWLVRCSNEVSIPEASDRTRRVHRALGLSPRTMGNHAAKRCSQFCDLASPPES